MTLDHITSDLDVLPAARPVQASAVDQLMLHVQAMSHAKTLADALCQTDMVPERYRGKPGNAAAAILYGAELGLNAIQSLQNIFTVHGQPSIYARTAVALLKRHGIKFHTIESGPTCVTIRAERDTEVEESTWTIERARDAKFTVNKKYETEPEAMLWAKAAMEVSRKIAPDVLLGIAYSAEEIELDRTPAPARIVSSRRGVDGLRAAITAPVISPKIVGDDIEDDDEDEQPAAKAMSAATRKKWYGRLIELLDESEVDDDDRMLAIAEVLKCEQPDTVDALTDDQLRNVVNELNVMSKAGELAERMGDLLNIAALREAEVSA